MTPRARLLTLIDAVRECGVGTAHLLTEWRRQLRDDPMLVSLATAPYDDEPMTLDEDAGVEQAREQYRRGESLTPEDAKRRLLR